MSMVGSAKGHCHSPLANWVGKQRTNMKSKRRTGNSGSLPARMLGVGFLAASALVVLGLNAQTETMELYQSRRQTFFPAASQGYIGQR
jgi:hypothetical protein